MSDASVRKVVVDTTIHFSAWRTRNADSPHKEVVVRATRRHFDIVVSPRLLAEIYEKMTETLGVPDDLAGRYIKLLRVAGRLYADVANDVIWCSDPKDAYVFVLAHHSNAWCIVAFDKIFFDRSRQLSARSFCCMKPVEFLGTLRSSREEPPGFRSAHDGDMASLTDAVSPSEPPPAPADRPQYPA